VLDILISPLVVLGLMMLFVVAAWTLRIYAIPRGLSDAARTARIHDSELIELLRQRMEMREKALELAEQSLKKQDEIIRLLRQLVEDPGHFKSTQS
jgi:hypothetical protein